jgi:hypothetical protein
MERIRKYAPRIIQETDNPSPKAGATNKRAIQQEMTPQAYRIRLERENLSCLTLKPSFCFFGWGIDQLQQKVINIFGRFLMLHQLRASVV